MLRKKVILEISQCSQKTSVPGYFFKESCRSQLKTLLRKRHWHRRFPVNFGKFLRTSV